MDQLLSVSTNLIKSWFDGRSGKNYQIREELLYNYYTEKPGGSFLLQFKQKVVLLADVKMFDAVLHPFPS